MGFWLLNDVMIESCVYDVFSALDDDDVAVLDLIARSGGDLSRPRPITGSSAREDQVQEYSLDGKDLNSN